MFFDFFLILMNIFNLLCELQVYMRSHSLKDELHQIINAYISKREMNVVFSYLNIFLSVKPSYFYNYLLIVKKLLYMFKDIEINMVILNASLYNKLLYAGLIDIIAFEKEVKQTKNQQENFINSCTVTDNFITSFQSYFKDQSHLINSYEHSYGMDIDFVEIYNSINKIHLINLEKINDMDYIYMINCFKTEKYQCRSQGLTGNFNYEEDYCCNARVYKLEIIPYVHFLKSKDLYINQIIMYSFNGDLSKLEINLPALNHDESLLSVCMVDCPIMFSNLQCSMLSKVRCLAYCQSYSALSISEEIIPSVILYSILCLNFMLILNVRDHVSLDHIEKVFHLLAKINQSEKEETNSEYYDIMYYEKQYQIFTISERDKNYLEDILLSLEGGVFYAVYQLILLNKYFYFKNDIIDCLDISHYNIFNAKTTLLPQNVCKSLTYVIQFLSNVSFYEGFAITSISNFVFPVDIDSSFITDMSFLFSSCCNLVDIDLSNINTSCVKNMDNMFRACSKLKTLNLKSFNTSNVISMRDMFRGCLNLNHLNISSFRTLSVERLDGMFESCSSITYIDISNFNTQKVQSMKNMFRGCTSLSIINISSLYTLNVRDSSNMFTGCTSLSHIIYLSDETSYIKNIIEEIPPTTLLITNDEYNDNIKFYTLLNIDWDFKEIEYNQKKCLILKYRHKGNSFVDVGAFKLFDELFQNFECVSFCEMFSECETLKSIAFPPKFDTSKVVDMSYMFYNCMSLEELDLGMFNTSNVLNMSHMFHKCSNLTKVIIRSFNAPKVTNLENMFRDCSSLVQLKFGLFSAESVLSTACMFKGCSKLQIADLSPFYPRNVENMREMFSGCGLLSSLDLSGFVTNDNTKVEAIFEQCQNLSLFLYTEQNINRVQHIHKKLPKMCQIVTKNRYNERSNFTALLNADWEFIEMEINQKPTIHIKYRHKNTTLIDDKTFHIFEELHKYYDHISFSEMFYGCNMLQSINFPPNFDTSRVINMTSMFHKCSSLTSLNLSMFNTSNVSSMVNMFCKCGKLTKLDLHNFDTGNVVDMTGMFKLCSSLIDLNIPFNTTKVTSFSNMFEYCSSLTVLLLTSFNTSHVKNMNSMFKFCYNLQLIDLTSFDTSKLQSTDMMFTGCKKLKTILYSANNIVKIKNILKETRPDVKIADLSVHSDEKKCHL